MYITNVENDLLHGVEFYFIHLFILPISTYSL